MIKKHTSQEIANSCINEINDDNYDKVWVSEESLIKLLNKLDKCKDFNHEFNSGIWYAVSKIKQALNN